MPRQLCRVTSISCRTYSSQVLTFARARWKTKRLPSIARSRSAARVRSPVTTSTSGPRGRRAIVPGCGRERRILCPADSNCRASSWPMNPVAPSTRISACRDVPVGATGEEEGPRPGRATPRRPPPADLGTESDDVPPHLGGEPAIESPTQPGVERLQGPRDAQAVGASLGGEFELREHVRVKVSPRLCREGIRPRPGSSDSGRNPSRTGYDGEARRGPAPDRPWRSPASPGRGSSAP